MPPADAIASAASAARATSDVDLARVTVTYGPAQAAVSALHGLSLTIAAGEFVVLVGPSGCGKTTLLRVVAGFEKPTMGTVHVHRRVGVVFQQPRLFPWRTVGGNIAFALAQQGVPPRERTTRTQELLRRVGLPGLAKRRTWQLSGGQQQRVAIARALAAEPSILLMDEPFAALDALTRERLQEEVRTLTAATGITVLFVTHSTEEAIALGSRVLVMAPNPGRFVNEVTVPLPREPETDIATLRNTAQFATLRSALTEMIRTSTDNNPQGTAHLPKPGSGRSQ
ncbi:ABC transporter ATP-binding protein [Streptomyces sp. NPDC051776]|uniref:ABC transporter ATP-binding protein n=1 Tax=Streptomyces sp. NPDC051776 TaxID=3155414 RepID=UPI00343AE75E